MNLYRMVFIENCITLLLMTIVILGLYYMGAGNSSFWALLMLLNIGTVKKEKQEHKRC